MHVIENDFKVFFDIFKKGFYDMVSLVYNVSHKGEIGASKMYDLSFAVERHLTELV